MSLLELDQVTKVYRVGTFGGDVTPALRDVSFGVDRGEVVSLIGESGSGKTTIGRMILRLIPATQRAGAFDGTRHRRPAAGDRCGSTTATSRASSRTRSARTTRSTRPTASSS